MNTTTTPDLYVRSDVLTTPDPVTDLLPVAFVRDFHLRVPNDGGVDDAYIERAIRSAYESAERETRRALLPQDRQLVMSAFPYDAYSNWIGYQLGYTLPGFVGRRQILLLDPPLISVDSVQYYDTSGELQTMAEDTYSVSRPRGPHAKHGFLLPDPVTRPWPVAQSRPDAVFVNYRAGYSLAGSPEIEVGSPLPSTAIPAEIVSGMLLLVGELYKQRSDSVGGMTVTPAVLRSRDIFLGYRSYR